MKHSESIGAIAKALAAAQSEYVVVPKNKTAKVKMKSGGEFSYNYADLADCLSMALPRLAKQGVAFSQPHVIVDGKLRVVTYLLHESGEWMHSDGIEISEEGDPQQFGAESTYFRRYDGCSFIGVAPDEDTDAQQAGKRTPRPVTPASILPSGAISQQPAGQNRGTQGPSQPTSGAQAEFVPPDGIVVTVKSITDIPGKPAEPGKRAVNPYINVHFLESHNGCTSASCFDDKLWPLLKESVGLLCQLQIVEKDSNGKHFINIVEVPFSGGEMFKNGKPVQIFEPEGRNQQA